MEDRIGVGDNYLFAIDGASDLAASHVTSHSSDAAWLSESLRKGLERLLPNMEKDLPEVLHEIAANLKAEYDTCWREKADGTPDYPSAGVAILRLRDETLEYLGLGDCTVTLEDSQGKIEVLEETRLTTLDRGVLERMMTLCQETGCSMLQAKESLKGLLRYNRDLRNHPEGYWIFDPSGAGIPYARQKTWPAAQIKVAAVMTDGFAQLAEPFKLVEDMPDLHRKIKEKGLAMLSLQLFSSQQTDSDCCRFPRFKTMDDTGAAWAILE